MISVKSARQVIDALNAEGPDIDIILADLDLPMAKGMKMLKYITRDKALRRIPVISKMSYSQYPLLRYHKLKRVLIIELFLLY